MKQDWNQTYALKKEIDVCAAGRKSFYDARAYYRGIGYLGHLTQPAPIARAKAFAAMLEGVEPHVYENDLIVGSMAGMFPDKETLTDISYYENFDAIYGKRGWLQGCDHFAPAYDRFLALGVPGILEEIAQAKRQYEGDSSKTVFLEACRISMEAFGRMILKYADTAVDETVCTVCRHLTKTPPRTFREALQLVWFAHIAFQYQQLNAMALGRMDQYLYPFYKKDIEEGLLTQEKAQLLLENVFMKMHEHRAFCDHEDICNICIGGITPEGEDAVNELSYLILWAVGHCNIPGPNLSARIHPRTPQKLLTESLKVIGTGLGYPALMNDIPNIEALCAKGYEQQDANNYCMVGCIENFLAGLQPPWSDGRYNTVKMLELALNSGCDPRTGQRLGPKTKAAADFVSMEDVMEAYRIQLKAGAEAYAAQIIQQNSRLNNENFVNPFLSCLSYGCVEKGLDICNGGARYKAAHGACTMGIGTIADSLAALEQCVFVQKEISMERLLAALKADFVGYEKERALLLKAPKYGNDDDRADKYAVWFVEYMADLFDSYRLADGGRFYTAMASNVANIPAGLECGATPDGRRANEPLSDAASPTYGRDKCGPTGTVMSLSKPNYSRVACGTVVNQKFSPHMFEGEENIQRLASLIRVYFERGGQEMQINAVSRQDLLDAMETPEKYENLVIRVSGFSAYYVKLDREVQLDILSRTEHSQG